MEFQNSSGSEDEYSEDEDFLAWMNDPEVKKRIEEQEKKRDDAISQNLERINKADKTEVEDLVKAQIELLGNRELYYRISSNLEDHKFEPFFLKEQYKLFQFREDFFYDKFGSYTEGRNIWFTDGADDSHGFDTVPYQITKNFENIMKFSCFKDFGKSTSSPIYLENDEMLSNEANLRFNKILTMDEDYLREIVFDKVLEETCLNFGDVAHMIVAEYSTAPPTLLEIAMKTVLLHKIPLHDEAQELPCKAVCCTDLKQKALHGLYKSSDDDIPANLSAIGQKLFEELKEECNKVQPKEMLCGLLVNWKGSYGFIMPDRMQKNVFLHISEVEKPRPFLTPGLRIEFQVEVQEDGRERAVLARVVE